MRNSFDIQRGLSLLLYALCLQVVSAQTYPDKGEEWRDEELSRARGLFNNSDLSPVDDAFARKDLRMLWTYFLKANHNQFGLEVDGRKKEVQAKRIEQEKQLVLNKEIRERAGDFLKQLPGHAKEFGDMIERLSSWVGHYHDRAKGFAKMGELGSDECIQQLGRFLFDKRNPDKGTGMYYRDPPANEEYAVDNLHRALGDKSPLGKHALSPTGMMNAEMEEKLREWWLTSEEAEPYRRGLLASGVTLPLGYPAFPGWEGSKVPPPVIQVPVVLAETPEWLWPLTGALLAVLAVLSTVLVVQKRRAVR